MNGIYAGKWYNDERVKEQEYIGDKMSILLGVPRLRQLRVQKGMSSMLGCIVKIALSVKKNRNLHFLVFMSLAYFKLTSTVQ